MSSVRIIKMTVQIVKMYSDIFAQSHREKMFLPGTICDFSTEYSEKVLGFSRVIWLTKNCVGYLT